MMPSRRHTRAHNRATYITRERHLNATERTTERATGHTAAPPNTEAAPPRPATADHNIDYGNDHGSKKGNDYGSDPPPF